MYLGKIMEIGSKDDVFLKPRHPYTISLLEAVPSVGKGKRIRKVPRGEIPSPLDPPKGCLFHTRCVEAKEICAEKNLKRQKFHRVILVGVIFVNDELGGFVEDGQSSSNLRK